MKVSVIILNYNVRYFLEQCIRSVERALGSIEGEIIVIDNNSSDDSCAMVKQRFPHVILIENTENVGFSKANNQAVAVAQGEYICILNPDTAVAEDTFINSLHYSENTTNIGALGVYLMDGTGHFLPESKRNVPTPTASLLKLFGIGSRYYAKHLSEEEKGRAAILVGAYMFVKRSIYNEVGGFDEDYFMYGEDIDLSYKIEKAGYENHYLGTTEVLHYKGESTQRDEVYYDRFYGAMQIFYKKHFKPNPLYNFLMNLGVGVFKRTRRSNGKRRSSMQPDRAYVFTENLYLLKGLSEKLDLPLKSASKAIFQEENFSNSMLIFDAEYMQYSQIFGIMKRFKNNNNQFRIHPPKSQFIIGSDQSDEKGSVIVF
ncbi:glycosyltransferase family 2 protein [Altibacter sp.]|uniref:glycosyltransferase family 2 protein n=1 Tax=Altibacter sp. TaxID=2024823 RepID=UPI000C9672B9|nr:glycosyltransferase family 2 protein [Altibacter sp.]MAP54746.1 glycosyl transferase family 2 [Altibacter sp.]